MLEKLKKEIRNTLNCERASVYSYAKSLDDAEDIHKGWIEALEYCIEKIELLESSVNQNSDLK